MKAQWSWSPTRIPTFIVTYKPLQSSVADTFLNSQTSSLHLHCFFLVPQWYSASPQCHPSWLYYSCHLVGHITWEHPEPHLTSPDLTSLHLRSLHFRPTSPEDPQFWWHHLRLTRPHLTSLEYHLMSRWGTSTSPEVLWMVYKDGGWTVIPQGSSFLYCSVLS